MFPLTPNIYIGNGHGVGDVKDYVGSQSATESAIAAKAEKITSLINGGANIADKTLSEYSEIKGGKSKDASHNLPGASQSIQSSEFGTSNKPK
jgi:hypothetical protein